MPTLLTWFTRVDRGLTTWMARYGIGFSRIALARLCPFRSFRRLPTRSTRPVKTYHSSLEWAGLTLARWSILCLKRCLTFLHIGLDRDIQKSLRPS
jgi:hypothetical protein